MDKNNDHLKVVGLVTKAGAGDQDSLSQLTELVKGRLLAYIYRLTLDRNLADDLLQETLLEMVESVKDIRNADRFWAWLFRTALGKAQHYFRQQRQKPAAPVSVLEKEFPFEPASDVPQALAELERKELSNAVLEAVYDLKLNYRSVVALRCFEQMSYSDIAELMDCSEIKARVLFCRAKVALKKKLSRHGFSGAYLLAALGLFGLLTTPAKAASTAGAVTATSLEAGPAAVLLTAMGTKIGIAIAAVITAATVTITINYFLYVMAGIILFLFFLSMTTLLWLYE